MVREYCLCGCLKGAHEEMTLVCTSRRCRCLQYVPLLARPGSLRGVPTPLAADLDAIRRHNRKVRQAVLTEAV